MTRHVRYVYVEYQPDLQNPRDTIFLGVIVERSTSKYREVAIVGREPTTGVTPHELEGIGRLAERQIRNWMKTAQAAIDEVCDKRDQDPFEVLARTFNWNLYVTRPGDLRVARHADIDDVARELCGQRLPGFAWRGARELAHDSNPVPGDMVPAWMVDSLANKADCRVA